MGGGNYVNASCGKQRIGKKWEHWFPILGYLVWSILSKGFFYWFFLKSFLQSLIWMNGGSSSRNAKGEKKGRLSLSVDASLRYRRSGFGGERHSYVWYYLIAQTFTFVLVLRLVFLRGRPSLFCFQSRFFLLRNNTGCGPWSKQRQPKLMFCV